MATVYIFLNLFAVHLKKGREGGLKINEPQFKIAGQIQKKTAPDMGN